MFVYCQLLVPIHGLVSGLFYSHKKPLTHLRYKGKAVMGRRRRKTDDHFFLKLREITGRDHGVRVIWSCGLLRWNQITWSLRVNHSVTNQIYSSFLSLFPRRPLTVKRVILQLQLILKVRDVWLELKRIRECSSGTLPGRGHALRLGTLTRGHVLNIYFYMGKRNWVSVSTFHRSERKLPQHRKCPFIHPPRYFSLQRSIGELRVIFMKKKWNADVASVADIRHTSYIRYTPSTFYQPRVLIIKY